MAPGAKFATLDSVSWYNERRLLGPIGDIPPVEFEQMYDRRQSEVPFVLQLPALDVMGNLVDRGLADIDDRFPAGMMILDLLIHRELPGRIRPGGVASRDSAAGWR